MTNKFERQPEPQLLEMAAHLAGVGHWRFEVSSGKISWSAETYRIHGLPQADGEPDYDKALALYVPESAELITRLVDRALTTGQGYDLEAAIRRPDGAIRYVAAKAECVLRSDGTVEALFGVFQDITERTQSERFMRALTDHIPAMVAYWDTNLRCRYANGQYLDWFGRNPTEMLGVSMQELMGPELFQRNEPFIRGAMAGRPQSFERTLIKPSGEVGHTQARYIPDIDAEGRVLGMVVLVSDVTTLKETELLLSQANAAADKTLAELEAALNVKREFLSNISHELRNPLTGIIGFSDLLAEPMTLSVEEFTKTIRNIRNASTDLLRTVNDLLEFAKLEAGQVSIKLAPADPYSIGMHALEFFEPQLDEKRLSHTLTASGLPAVVMADHVRIRQILLNLIGNAVKFTTAGSVDLQVTYDRLRKVLRYAVTDTGPGIPSEDHARVFQRFSQIDSSSARRSGGTGLGLAICKGLADAMGASVGFVSTIGEGSEFWLEVPCEPGPTQAAPEPDRQAGAVCAEPLQHLRLLVVDDHPINRELVTRLLEPLGVAVVEAAGGLEAVALASCDQFDIILLDILMPDIGGLATARMIRTGSGLSRLARIVAFTAGSDFEQGQLGSGLFDDRLSKPFRAKDLLDLLARNPRGQGSD